MSAVPTTWMIRSPRGTFAEDWEETGIVAIGYGGIGGDLTRFTEYKAAVDALMTEAAGTPHIKQTQVWQVARFGTDVREGERALTYDTGRREYMYGVLGQYRFDADPDARMPHVRHVQWQGRFPRDILSKSAKSGLGSLLTVFSPREEVSAEIHRIICGGTGAGAPPARPTTAPETAEIDDADDIATGDFESLNDHATELIKDRVMSLDDAEMEHLVAGVLRAMGYKTRVSPTGSDRGRDVVASPDGLGFGHPRIVVEVKHRRGATSAPTIRGLSGAMTPSDRGLFVSTGGFTKDARYEVDRANPPITLLDSDELVELLTDNYPATDPQTKALVPLKSLYWPA